MTDGQTQEIGGLGCKSINMRRGMDLLCTHNWSPLKSPKATTVASGNTPIDPAFRSALPLNRFGGNGHIAEAVGVPRSAAKRETQTEVNRGHPILATGTDDQLLWLMRRQQSKASSGGIRGKQKGGYMARGSRLGGSAERDGNEEELQRPVPRAGASRPPRGPLRSDP